MIWILPTAQLTAPVPLSNRIPDVRALFSYDDFPDYLLHGSELWRTVYTRTTVRDDGTVQNCAAETTSGDARLNAYTCALILKRAKFFPAKWIDGSAVYSVLRFPVSWIITNSIPTNEQRMKATIPDLELSVDRLPKGAHTMVDITVEVAADENGRLVSCVEFPPLPRDRQRHFPELVSIACDQAEKTLSARPPLNTSGHSVRSVQTASVRLRLDHGDQPNVCNGSSAAIAGLTAGMGGKLPLALAQKGPLSRAIYLSRVCALTYRFVESADR